MFSLYYLNASPLNANKFNAIVLYIALNAVNFGLVRAVSWQCSDNNDSIYRPDAIVCPLYVSSHCEDDLLQFNLLKSRNKHEQQ